MNMKRIYYEYQPGVLLVVPYTSIMGHSESSYMAKRIVDEVKKSAARTVVFDLKNISHMNSSFAMMLLMVKKTLLDMGHDISIVNHSSQVRQVLEMVGLQEHLRTAWFYSL